MSAMVMPSASPRESKKVLYVSGFVTGEYLMLVYLLARFQGRNYNVGEIGP